MDDEFIAFGAGDATTYPSSEAHGRLEMTAPSFDSLIRNELPPWLTAKDSKKDLHPFVRLHNEILAFCDYIEPSEKEMAIRKSVVQEMTSLVQECFPEATVHVFGSQMTKIMSPTSDIDLVMLNVADSYGNSVDCLHKLADRMRRKRVASYLEVVDGAKVPIVKLDHIESGLAVDICCNTSTGLETGTLLKKFTREYPPLKPIVLVLKVFLGQRKLNDTYSGGIGSFLLTCMVVSMCQMRMRQALFRGCPPSSLTWNLGALLLDFFNLYGTSFNYYHVGISINNGGYYFSKRARASEEAEKATAAKIQATYGSGGGEEAAQKVGEQVAYEWYNPARPGQLAVENPNMPELNVGKGSFMVTKIKRSFEFAQQVLSSFMTEDRAPVSFLSLIIRPSDPSLIGRRGPESIAENSRSDDSRADGRNDASDRAASRDSFTGALGKRKY